MEIRDQLYVAILFVILCSSCVAQNGMEKPKSLVNLGLMAADHIPCDFPYFPIPYGCWCGITLPWPCPYKPVDDFDDLCKTHDYCYEEAEDSMGCSIWDEYLWLYKWHNGEDGEIICDDTNDPCQAYICGCDKNVIDSISEAAALFGCPKGDPGCSEVPDNSTCR